MSLWNILVFIIPGLYAALVFFFGIWLGRRWQKEEDEIWRGVRK